MSTTIKHSQIKNRDLTGASFDSELKFYDETQNYSTNDIVFYAGRFYKAKQNIPATIEGDLQYSSINQSTSWQDITYELLFKQREVTINNAGDVFSIQLENPNDTFMKHCFILKYNAPQSNITQPIANFDSNEVMWDYDTEWVKANGVDISLYENAGVNEWNAFFGNQRPDQLYFVFAINYDSLSAAVALDKIEILADIDEYWYDDTHSHNIKYTQNTISVKFSSSGMYKINYSE